MEAGDNPELRAKLEELEHELEVRLIGLLSDSHDSMLSVTAHMLLSLSCAFLAVPLISTIRSIHANNLPIGRGHHTERV